MIDIGRFHPAPGFVKKTEAHLVQVIDALGKVNISFDLPQVWQNVLIEVYQVFRARSWRHQRVDQFLSDRKSSHGVKVLGVRFLAIPVALNRFELVLNHKCVKLLQP